MDNNDREFEEDMLAIIREEKEGPTTDGSEFLNPTGEGMEPEQIRDEAQTSVDCDDDGGRQFQPE